MRYLTTASIRALPERRKEKNRPLFLLNVKYHLFWTLLALNTINEYTYCCIKCLLHPRHMSLSFWIASSNDNFNIWHSLHKIHICKHCIVLKCCLLSNMTQRETKSYTLQNTAVLCLQYNESHVAPLVIRERAVTNWNCHRYIRSCVCQITNDPRGK